MCSHATVTDSDLLSLIGTYDWDLYFYLLGRSTHQNLMSCSRILNSIKGFKLNQLQWSNITWRFHREPVKYDPVEINLVDVKTEKVIGETYERLAFKRVMKNREDRLYANKIDYLMDTNDASDVFMCMIVFERYNYCITLPLSTDKVNQHTPTCWLIIGISC